MKEGESVVRHPWSTKPFSVKRLQAPSYLIEAISDTATEANDTVKEESNPNTNSAAEDVVAPDEEEEEADRTWFPEALTWEWIATARVFPIKRIPKQLRLLWGDVMAHALQKVAISPNDQRRWKILFALPKLCLRLTPRGGKKKQKAFTVAPFIIERLKKAKAGEWKALWEEVQPRDKKKKPGTHVEEGVSFGLRERVLSLVEEGQLSKAVQALDCGDA